MHMLTHTKFFSVYQIMIAVEFDWKPLRGMLRKVDGLNLSCGMGLVLRFDLMQEQVTSVSYSIIFDACFGKGGAEAVLKRTKSGKLEITPGEADYLSEIAEFVGYRRWPKMRVLSATGKFLNTCQCF